jgi:hypothetical protein
VSEPTIHESGQPAASSAPLYIALLLTAMLAGAAYRLRTEGIFSCQADGYGADWYVAYCQATAYGDFEHGAFWFDLEPTIPHFVSNADALFLGDSHMQIAFSTRGTEDWFSARSAPYYLLGFGYDGNVVFARELLKKDPPHAKVYVINLDKFFRSSPTPPAAAVMGERGAWARYQLKYFAQLGHRAICGRVPICGDHYVIFRSRQTGAYRPAGFSHFEAQGVSSDFTADPSAIERAAALGADFLSFLPVPSECVILTVVPSVKTKTGIASGVAAALGTKLVAPEIDGLTTYDGSHLDHESAERWSRAFFAAAAPQLEKCLGTPR